MSKITVLGIGNRLLCDDGIGIYIVEELLRNSPPSGIQFVIGETDIDYCLDVVTGSDYVVIVDAVISGSEPGSVSIFSLDEETLAGEKLPIYGHDCHLVNELLRKNLLHKGRMPKGYIIGVEPSEICFNMGLSPTLAGLFTVITDKVRDHIGSCLTGLASMYPLYPMGASWNLGASSSAHSNP